MKRTKGQLTGHYAARVIDWCIARWFKLSIILCIVYATYSVHTLVLDFETVGQRFLDFSEYLHDRLEKEGTLT